MTEKPKEVEICTNCKHDVEPHEVIEHKGLDEPMRLCKPCGLLMELE